MEKSPSPAELVDHKESGWFEGKRYNVGYLYVWASERLPVGVVDVSSLQNQLEGLEYSPLSLSKVDTSKPILLSHTGHIIDGKHRLYKAAVENRQTIKVIRLPKELPLEAEL